MPSVILVESFISVWKLFQAGFLNAVSLLGSVFTPEQEILLREYLSGSSLIYLMLDNDESGQKCQKECLTRLGKDYFIKAPDYIKYGLKPHRLEVEVLKQ